MTTQQGLYTSYAQELAARSLTVEDFEDASQALLALKREDRLLAREVALKILREQIGDVYYRALAFDILYSVALNDAVAYIELNAGTESPYVVGEMIESVTEDAGALESRDEILKAVLLLRKSLKLRSSEDIRSLAAQIARFDEAFPSR